MAVLDELVQKITDPDLRSRIAAEVDRLAKQKKFGLVFEEHLPECTPLWDIPVKRGAKVARKAGPVSELYTVIKLENGQATCLKIDRSATDVFAVDELVTVAEFGEPIYPCLKPIDSICNAPDSGLWHTLIEADNYHALQLLEYLYAGKVDCIYIDPPYNTGARDWKYNNDYVDNNDQYRHSKWLSMMQKRLKIAKKLLNPNDSVLIITIDEKEYLHLGCLLEELFPESNIQMITTVINPSGTMRADEFSRVEEYIYICRFGNSAIVKTDENMLGNDYSMTKSRLWFPLSRSNWLRTVKNPQFFPIYIDPNTRQIVSVGEPMSQNTKQDEFPQIEGTVAVFPVRDDGEEASWGAVPKTTRKWIEEGFVRVGDYDKKTNRWSIQYIRTNWQKKIIDGEVEFEGKRDDGSIDVDKAISVYTSTLVVTNDSLEHFLPADTETRLGLDIMDREFVTYDTAQVVVRNISLDQARAIADELAGIENVKEVKFDDSSDHYKELSALFDVTFNGASDDPSSKTALNEIEDRLSPYDLYVNTKVGNPLKVIIDNEMVIVDIMGFVLIKAVLISLLSVFCLMPGLLVTFSGLIDRTAHRKFLPDVPFLGKFAYRTRKVVPFLFAALLIGAYFCSSRAHYVYDQYSVESIRKNEIQLAKEKIRTTFGTPNTFAMIIPAGDNDSEKEIVSEVKDLRHTLSVTGLSDIDAIGDYKLLDEVTPRQFAELLDIDIEVAELAYGSYALEHNEYGKAITGMDSYRIALLDIFDYLLESREDVTLNLDQETQDKIDEMKEELDDGKLQLLSDDWSRIVIDSDVPYEEAESYEYLSALRGIVARYYDESYIIGDTTSCSDLKSSFENDNTVITILEIVFVTLILIFTFHSVGLPLLLIVVIQGSILINFSSPFLHNKNLFFLTYLIISAIQMGANIDYAIVISDRYLESRRYMEPKEAITDALNKAFPTIVTSGTMMAAAGVVIALVASNETISAIGVYLGKGTLISIFLVTCVLPQILLLGDGVISKTSFTTQIGTMFSHAGSVRLDGHVRGYVSGYIDAEVRGRFNGEVNVHMDIDTTASEESPEGLSTSREEAEKP